MTAGLTMCGALPTCDGKLAVGPDFKVIKLGSCCGTNGLYDSTQLRTVNRLNPQAPNPGK